MNENNRKHSIWMGVGEKVISFVIGVVIASFFLGGARARVQNLGRDMEAWKVEWKERDKDIIRMDLEGSVATKHFIHSYEKEQAKQYERLQALEIAIGHIPTIELRLERLEKNHNNQTERKP